MLPARKNKRGELIEASEFIEYWQIARSPHDVAEKFGISYGMATRWATEYRKQGINLKVMRIKGEPRWTEYGQRGGVPSHKINKGIDPEE